MYRVYQVLIIIVCLYSVTSKTPPTPEWPQNYKACIQFQTQRQFITVGWYVDSDGERMRLDSYGIPEENKYTYEAGHVNNFKYACELIGEPLYVYIYHYRIGKELNIIPSPDPPYKQCNVQNISNAFPPSPLLQNLMFIERASDNITVYDHWRSEYFLFTMDYYFHAANGLPYKVYVNSELQQFISVEVGEQPDEVFLPPKHVDCYYV